MSIGPSSGLAGSVAGSPLARASSSESDRASQEVGAQQRQVNSEKKAESAAGIGETDGENKEASDRDPDGRRLWEAAPDDGAESDDTENAPARGKDATAQSGNLLDLSG